MNRDFKGIWIPREIWLCKGLSVQEKALWAEIHSLYDREKGGCFASNEYLCEFMSIKERRLQEMISNLKEHKLIVQVSFDGRVRILKAISPVEQENCASEVQKSAPQGCRKVRVREVKKCTSPPIHREKNITKKTTPKPPSAEKGSVVGFLEKKIFDCLQDLPIPQADKVRLSQQFPEQAVKDAVDHCNDPGFKVKKTLEASIFYFCKNPGHITESKETAAKRKQQEEDEKEERILVAKQSSSEIYKRNWKRLKENNIDLYSANEYIQITTERFIEKIYYANEKFWQMFEYIMSKMDLKLNRTSLQLHKTS